MTEAEKKKETDIKKIIEPWNAVVVDPNTSSRVRLAGTLVELGIKRTQIGMAGTIGEAATEIERLKPKIILSDYSLGNSTGLELIENQRKHFPNPRERLFCLVTGNTAQSAVAEAAEEDVDAFVLKPYRPESLKKALMTAFDQKIFPTPYLIKIEEGKALLFGGSPEKSLALFNEAMTLDKKPTLACFYLGQAEVMLRALQSADHAFKTGLQHNRIHYKCLVGLFDLLMTQQRSKEAYEIVRQISKFFPANPERLTIVLKLAIQTRNFPDIVDYYQVFTKLDRRPPPLVIAICAAMSVTGKYHLKKGEREKAFEHFDKAAISSAGKTMILRYLVESIVRYGAPEEALKFLARFPPDTQSSADYLCAEYLIQSKKEEGTKLVQQGRKIIKQGVSDPKVYQILIENLKKVGHADAALELTQTAQKAFPEEFTTDTPSASEAA